MLISKIAGSSLLAASLTVATMSAPAAVQTSITYETRALTGTDGVLGPGLGAGVYFSNFNFSTPVINNSGQTAFRGHLTGTGVGGGNSFGIWSEGRGAGLSLVARAGDAAPFAGTDIVFNGLTEPILNDGGQTLILGNFIGTGVDAMNDIGVWLDTGSGLTLVAREGDAAPGTPAGVNFGSFSTLPFPDYALNDGGQVALTGSLAGTGVTSTNNFGIWSQGGGTGLELIARKGDAVPGMGGGVTFSTFSDRVRFNSAGQVAFSGRFAGPGVNRFNDYGVWSGTGGIGLRLVARSGDAAPGTDTGVTFNAFRVPALNDAGQIAFLGGVSGPGVTISEDEGIWSERSGSGLVLIAREGDPAPGTAPGVNFLALESPVINATGDIAFESFLAGTGVTGSNNHGIWTEGGGSGLKLIARTGEDAPGTPAGVTFRDFVRPMINGAGQTAFIGSIEGPGLTIGDNRGIWATDREGVLQLIVRSGDVIDVNADPLIEDLRTLSSLSIIPGSGNEDGDGSSFNDLGQLVFRAEFTDGSEGIIVSNRVAVPEPGSLVALTLSGFLILRRRR